VSHPPTAVGARADSAAALRIDVKGGLVRVGCVCDPRLVDEVRALPGRRYLPEAREWVAPARRDVLVRLQALTEELGERAEVTRVARRRFERVCPGRIDRDAEGFSVRFGYTHRRLELVREVAERRWEPRSRTWRVPATRAGALGLLALLDSGEFTAAQSVRSALEQLAAAKPTRSDARSNDDVSPQLRSSPTAHWRHITRGPIFNANPQCHQWIEGVGWCVRIRVDPERRRARRAGR
jgi:hypothetical protein